MKTPLSQPTQPAPTSPRLRRVRPWWLVGISIVLLTLALLVTWTVLPTHASQPAAKKVKPILMVSPKGFLGLPGDGTGCKQLPDALSANDFGAVYCTVTLALPANAANGIHWTVNISGDDSQATKIAVQHTVILPGTGGNLAPGQHTTLFIVTTSVQTSINFTFVGPNNTVKVTYVFG